jgi:putative DNA methylase
MTPPRRRKLIEVALPLEAINRESAREKSIRHGHPSTLHLWWARRPLAACRAVLFAQLVDDPSARPDLYPTEAEQAVKRKELFALIERLVVWENANDTALLDEAHREILDSTDGKPPAILDPFAGGGSIPLEAQRLGLEAHASDLNPVAVLINKALIEIPPKWAGQPPVFPGSAESRMGEWPRATGLAEDVRRYGEWMRDEAERRIGHLYPKAKLPDGRRVPVIAWLWARTILCPNPSCRAEVPLVSTWWLSKKKDRPTWLNPIMEAGRLRFQVQVGASGQMAGPTAANKAGRGGVFSCLVCGATSSAEETHSQLNVQRKPKARLMTVVAHVGRQRVYMEPTERDESAVEAAKDLAAKVRSGDLFLQAPARGTFGGNAQGRRYGFFTFADYFTDRQLVALTAFCDLVPEVRQHAIADAMRSGRPPQESASYGEAISTYMALAVSRISDYASSLTTWANNPQMEILRNTFARQALPMTWDFAEGNVFGPSSGTVDIMVSAIAKVIERLPACGDAVVRQQDASSISVLDNTVVATDPPYYDNIGYSDLSDFFYVWLRRCLYSICPDIVATVLTPKSEELVANAYRFRGDRSAADRHFETGFVQTFSSIRKGADAEVPMTVFYAFKQAEEDVDGIASTGWETMLNALLTAGFGVTATWPIRTERSGRSVGIGTNVLASSVVLACRPRPLNAEATTRRGFLASLRAELPAALRHLQEGSVAPVDLAQAAIGPGMAVFSRHARVIETDGTEMTVRTALALINQALDEVLSKQEGDFDEDTRFCLAWFEQHGFTDGSSGVAETLSKAKNTSLEGLERGGVFRARAGKARLLSIEDLPEHYDPARDDRLSVWEVVMRLAKALAESGADEAAQIMAAASRLVDLDTAKELAYLLYSICERKGWAQTALLFNGLGTSWNDLESAVRGGGARRASSQAALDFDDD